jgi:diguanylate cyclase (GGDEF)-like protein/PAS domain S-box-containing protein
MLLHSYQYLNTLKLTLQLIVFRDALAICADSEPIEVPKGTSSQTPVNPIRPQYDETGRLAALHCLQVMDTPSEPEFDELVELAAAICEVPISLLSFIDNRRQWYKAAIGLAESERPLELTFCQYTIRQDDLLLVEDTKQDEMFVSHPSVTADPSVRFYAGISIKTPDGYPVGTLCVADLVPRHMSPTQIATLKVLARQANARIELREQRRTLERALADAEEAKDRLAASEARFKTFMDSAPFMGYLKDADGRFLFYNRAFCDHFSISPTEWIGRTDLETSPPDFADAYRRTDLAVLASGTLQVVEEVSQPPDSSAVFWRSYKFPCKDGETTLLGGLSIDLTQEIQQDRELTAYRYELEEANCRLHELATTDALTSLPNRRAFDEGLTTEFASARRSQRPLSVMLLDVDNFKQHNDRFGHDAGDDTLREFAKLLRQAARSDDLVARYGGEEFIFLLPDTTEAQAGELADRILRLIRSTPWPLEPITASAGIACLAPTTPTETHIVTLADEALYVAKRSGKDCAIGYSKYFNQPSAF